MSTIVHTTYCHLVSLTRIHYSYLYPCFRHHCWYQWPHDLEMALTLDLWLLADAVCRAATPWELCDGWLVLLEWTTPSPGPVESQAVKVRQTVNIGSRQSHFLNEWAQNIITNKLDERKGTHNRYKQTLPPWGMKMEVAAVTVAVMWQSVSRLERNHLLQAVLHKVENGWI